MPLTDVALPPEQPVGVDLFHAAGVTVCLTSTIFRPRSLLPLVRCSRLLLTSHSHALGRFNHVLAQPLTLFALLPVSEATALVCTTCLSSVFHFHDSLCRLTIRSSGYGAVRQSKKVR